MRNARDSAIFPVAKWCPAAKASAVPSLAAMTSILWARFVAHPASSSFIHCFDGLYLVTFRTSNLKSAWIYRDYTQICTVRLNKSLQLAMKDFTLTLRAEHAGLASRCPWCKHKCPLSHTIKSVLNFICNTSILEMPTTSYICSLTMSYSTLQPYSLMDFSFKVSQVLQQGVRNTSKEVGAVSLRNNSCQCFRSLWVAMGRHRSPTRSSMKKWAGFK